LSGVQAMITAFRLFLIKIILGDVLMMAMFFAQRVILGKTTFHEVPEALKQGCAEILLDSGLPELVPAEFREREETAG